MTDQITEPYPGVPPEKTADMESCVMQVMDKEGMDKPSAIAVCMSSVMEGKPLDEAVMIFKKTLETPAPAPVAEAATIKARVRAAIRALDELLTEKEIPEAIRGGVKSLRGEFTKTWADLANDAKSGFPRQSESEPQIATTHPIQPGGPVGGTERISESYAGAVEVISEANAAPGAILKMKFQPIRPGAGNAKDGHWYDADMLKSNAQKLVGAKQYETDHKPGEKSTRTWVSTITELNGFKDDGTPIMTTSIHDPNFAQRVNNLSTGKDENGGSLLEKLECSLLADGLANPGIREGKNYKVVESITNVESVDWVTRAGAGGKALEIAESEPQTTAEGATMADQNKVEVKTNPPVTETVAPVAEAVTTPAPAEPTRLSEVEVTALLEAEKRLPAASRARLAEGQYKDGEAVKAIITKELAYLKDLLGSGQPFGLGAPKQPEKSPTDRIAEADAALDKVNKKYGMNIGGNK